MYLSYKKISILEEITNFQKKRPIKISVIEILMGPASNKAVLKV